MDTFKLKNPEDVKMLPNKVLIEYTNSNKEAHYGKLSLEVQQGISYGSSSLSSSGKGRHLERSGKVINICSQLRHSISYTKKGNWLNKDWGWITDIEIEVGQTVWFSSSSWDNAPKFIVNNKKYMILDYHQLYACNQKLLNGFILCEEVEKSAETKLITRPKKQWYGNIYKVFMKANPVKYTNSIYEDTMDLFDVGDLIVTRFDRYPKLEEREHLTFSDKELFIFQSKEVIAKVQI